MSALEGSFAAGAFCHRDAGTPRTPRSDGTTAHAGGHTHTRLAVHYDIYQGAYVEAEDGAHRPVNASFAASHSSQPNSARRPRSASRNQQRHQQQTRGSSGSSRSIPDDESTSLVRADGNVQHSGTETSPKEADEGDASLTSSMAVDEAPASCCQLRWLAMVFICLITLGQYYIFDFPGAIGVGDHGTIQDRFHKYGKKYNQVMNQALYSIYSWPNTVLALAGGILIDKFLGLRRATVMFGILVCLGGWLFYIGVQSTQYPLMMVGRFVFGLGAESMSVAQSCFVARYFADGKGIALAFGITITVCRIASTGNFFCSPRIASSVGVEVAVLVGAIITCVSMAAAVVLSLVDKLAESKGKVAVWTRDETQKFQCLAVFKLPASSLLLGAICAFVYASIFPFIGIARDFFTTMYGLSGTAGSTQVSFYQLASAIGSPLLGGVVDRTGYVIVWLAGACLSFAGVHVIFALTNAVPAPVMMVAMGLVYCVLVSSLWPSAPKTVNAARVGLAYGAMTSMQNTLLALTPLATGSILDQFEVPQGGNGGNGTAAPHHHNHTLPPSLRAFWSTLETTTAAPKDGNANNNGMMESSRTGYQYVEVLFIGLATVSFVLTLVLWVVQRRIGGVLHLSGDAARARQAELAALQAAEEENGIDSNLL